MTSSFHNIIAFLTQPLGFDSLGIEFSIGIDRLIWLWPWRRTSGHAYISICASGTGEWGDVKFYSIKQAFYYWKNMEDAFNAYDPTRP